MNVTQELFEGMNAGSGIKTAVEPEFIRESWSITDDATADWACRKISEAKAEYDRLAALGKSRIEEITAQMEAAKKRYEGDTSYLTSKLQEYFEVVPHKATKTKESYKLLSGTLTKKRGGMQMKQDDVALLAYFRQTGKLDLIQTTEKPKWGEFKKQLEIAGDCVVDTTTGEVVEAVHLEEKPDVFVVEV